MNAVILLRVIHSPAQTQLAADYRSVDDRPIVVTNTPPTSVVINLLS